MGLFKRLSTLCCRERKQQYNIKHASAKELATLRDVEERAQHLAMCGEFDKAAMLLSKVLQARVFLLGGDAESTLDASHHLSDLLFKMGSREAGLYGFEQTLQRRERVHGRRHPKTLETVDRLAIAYSVEGRLTEAEKMLERLLPKNTDLDLSDQEVLHRLIIMGTVYHQQKKWAEAEHYYKKAIEGYEELLGSKSSDAIAALALLGTVHTHQRRLKDAETIFKRALAALSGCVEVEGPSPRNLVQSLAGVYLSHVHGGRGAQGIALPSAVNLNSGLGTARQSISRLSDMCINHVDSGIAPFEVLGRALALIGEDADALKAFQFRSIDPISELVQPVHCDGCQRSLVSTIGRHMCRTCYDVDLCDMCAVKYVACRPLNAEGHEVCEQHSFLSIPAACRWKGQQLDLVDRENAKQWLEGLCEKFGSAA